MQKEAFKRWLEGTGSSSNTICTRIGNCETICNYEGDIDALFDEDECSRLLERLTYSTDDERNNRPLQHSIPINGNKRTVTSTLKTALKLYIKFLKGEPYKTRATRQTTVGPVCQWPKWDLPAEDECYMFAKAATKYLRFLAPKIVETVVRDNEKNRDLFNDYLQSAGIDPELYLWEKSSCCFPGIRRYAGSAEISAHRGHSHISAIEDAIGLDDNDFPKHIWSFIFRGQQFGKFGPDGYSLAHLIDHKKDKNRMQSEFDFDCGHEYQKPFYGLYSCPSNTVYSPTNMIRLTDFNGAIRNMLFRKAESLYKDVCNIVPPYIKIKNNKNTRWELSEFKWANPVGTMDNMEAFLSDRKKKISKILEKLRRKG